MNFCLPSAPLGASIHAGISLGIIMMTNIAFIHYGDNVIEDNPPTVNDYETQQAPPHTDWLTNERPGYHYHKSFNLFYN